MGLVDYSDSDSETEVQAKPAAPPAQPAKKPFQKLVGSSGKIVVNLPTVSTDDDDANSNANADGQPPTKRAKTLGGTSRFSAFGSFLPPPKRTAAVSTNANANKSNAPAPGVHLRTAAEPAFVRDGGISDNMDGGGDDLGKKDTNGPTIPEGQKPAEQVKLVGQPLMFKPLSVARKKAPVKKKDNLTASSGIVTAAKNGPATATAPAPATPEKALEPPVKKKVSLFSISDEETNPAVSSTTEQETYNYEPLFTTSAPQDEGNDSAVTAPYPVYEAYPPPAQVQPQSCSQPQSSVPDPLSSIPLSSSARRDLFGRSGKISAANIKTFDMEQEYKHNEALRASGQATAYNPVRAIAPGKHSLRQVVQMAQSNAGALEESFARQRAAKREAGGRYGWI
ncbi:uncharacterized protein CTHT_0024450 [Thermochaetoides thermophila DSM 1495]|uniref:Mitotic checkpoint regulator, MAD2B-interacting-domain-containing protein n=1 Tax=Chaetomium thermophilum (strain DSM 1495 / CBS 144.50 / IMI 039719) TaxID=759272 RepID=G0S5D8_CHATD|nr:hypothetical protein CTHT_0024450 [Thermochaetoides thermophila DSM 1495]EGS20611.1 hypothetical protein CTHT_0024450 [Thermochaetoides thermophila DSM 1495]